MFRELIISPIKKKKKVCRQIHAQQESDTIFRGSNPSLLWACAGQMSGPVVFGPLVPMFLTKTW